jgi:hypothetical protein
MYFRVIRRQCSNGETIIRSEPTFKVELPPSSDLATLQSHIANWITSYDNSINVNLNNDNKDAIIATRPRSDQITIIPRGAPSHLLVMISPSPFFIIIHVDHHCIYSCISLSIVL